MDYDTAFNYFTLAAEQNNAGERRGCGLAAIHSIRMRTKGAGLPLAGMFKFFP
jgi:hypothetical protein